MVTEVNKGYVKYEVGEFPEDWNVILIGDSLKFKNGLNKESEYFGYGTPIVNYMDVFNNHGIRQKNIEGKVFLNREEKNSFSAKKGDVFFTRTSETQEEIGNSAVLLENIDDCVFSGFILRGRPKNNIVLSEYYQYCLTPNYVRNQIISTSSYTTRALTNGRFLSKVKLIIPPTIEEQKSIATALTDVDELIIGLEKLISKKKDIKRGAMQQLLTPPHMGGKRLPGFSGEWVEKSLGSICNYQNGKALESFFNNDGGFKVISIGNYSENGKYIDNNNFISKSKKPEISKFILSKGELAMLLNDKTSLGTIIGRVLLVDKDDEYVFNQRTMRLSPKEKINVEFLYFLINSTIVHNQIYLKAKPGTQIYVNTNDVIDLKVCFPNSVLEQKAIANIISDIDMEITQLETKKEKYQSIKQGMMQELLTGKTRLL